MQSDLNDFSLEPAEVSRRYQRPIQSGRRHFERITPGEWVFHVQDRRKLTTHAGAIVHRHALGTVYVYTQRPLLTTARQFDIHQLKTQRLDAGP